MNRSAGLSAALVLVASVLSASHPAQAEVIEFTAALAGTNEVPPNASAATGTATVSFDTETKTIEWTVTYDGLEGSLLGSHIHGPATPESNAGILVPLTATASPMVGQAALNDEQAAHLLGENTYLNLHSDKFPSGELRGQLVR